MGVEPTTIYSVTTLDQSFDDHLQPSKHSQVEHRRYYVSVRPSAFRVNVELQEGENSYNLSS